jgi:hypothetical protein
MTVLRRPSVVITMLAVLLSAAGCGGDATPQSPAPAPSASGAAAAPSSAAPSRSVAAGGLPAFTGDPVAHATAAVKLFEQGAAKDQIKTQKLAVVLVSDSKMCSAKDKPFSGTDKSAAPLELCVQDKPFTIAVSAASYPDFVTKTPNETAGLLLQRWAVGNAELNAESRNLGAAGCVAGATLNGLKGVLTPAEYGAIATWSDNLRGDYATGFGAAKQGGWQVCKTLNIVR